MIKVTLEKLDRKESPYKLTIANIPNLLELHEVNSVLDSIWKYLSQPAIIKGYSDEWIDVVHGGMINRLCILHTCREIKMSKLDFKDDIKRLASSLDFLVKKHTPPMLGSETTVTCGDVVCQGVEKEGEHGQQRNQNTESISRE